MSSQRSMLAVVLAAAIGLAGCVARPDSGGGLGDSCSDLGWGKVGGTLAGAGIGAWAGSTWNRAGHGTNTAAIIGGAAVGALGGFLAGKAIDDSTCRQARAARQQAFAVPIGQPIAWNGSNGAGTFTPMREGNMTYTPPSGPPSNLYCREVRMDGRVDGQPVTYVETACRMPDGTWRRAS